MMPDFRNVGCENDKVVSSPRESALLRHRCPACAAADYRCACPSLRQLPLEAAPLQGCFLLTMAAVPTLTQLLAAIL